MKKLYILLAICLVSSLLLMGCVPNINGEGDGFINEDGGIVNHPSGEENNTDGESSEGNGENDEGEENQAPDGGESNEENAPENPDGNNTSIPGENDPENPDGNNPSVPEENDPDSPNENNSENPGENDTKKPADTPVEPEQPKYGTGVGDLFIGVTLETLDGGSISTADLKGKVIILNIWATWCPPCKAELPDFNTVASEYKDDVVIIAAHSPNGNGAAQSYVNTNFPDTDIVFAYDTPNSMAYTVAGGDGYIPYTAIIDQSGVIVYSASGALSHSQLAAIIEGLLGE